MPNENGENGSQTPSEPWNRMFQEAWAAERTLSSQRHSDRAHRMAEADLKRKYSENPEAASELFGEGEDDVGSEINVRSPVTHNHYHSPPAEQKESPVPVSESDRPGMFRRALPWVAGIGLGAAGMGALAPFAMSMLQPDEPEPQREQRQPEVIERETNRDFRVLPPVIEDIE